MDIVAEIENVCRLHDIRDVLGIPQNKKLIVCPLPSHPHRHNTPSFSIFWFKGKQWWRCHGACGLEGDIVDLVGYLRVSGYNRYKLALRQQAARLVDDRFPIKVIIPEPQPTLAGDEWIQCLPPGEEVLAYANMRGLTPETLRQFNIGQNGRYMTLPCFEEQRLVGIKMRNMQATGKDGRYINWPGSKQGLFNIDAVRYKMEVVFVVKGEIPAMLMAQIGYLACAPTGGEGGWKESWRTALALARRIVIGDNDGPGRKLGERRATLLGAALEFPPDPFKDLDEWILARPEESRKQLDTWKEKYANPY